MLTTMPASGEYRPFGYLHPLYAESLRELGAPRGLPASGAWILEREVTGLSRRDAIGCYPIFCCRDWQGLPEDLSALDASLLSLTVVADPFGEHDPGLLQSAFPDLVRTFKRHFVTDLSRAPDGFVSSHHRRYARKSSREIDVEIVDDPTAVSDDWVHFYENLVARHAIRGVAAFTPAALATQLRVPGVVVFRALHRGEAVGMVLWYVQGGVGYYHLGAYSERGYELRASFAVFAQAIDYFRERRLEWLSLGAGAGLREDEADGLSRFKRGWSTGTRTAYLCGRIFDAPGYAEAVRRKGSPPTGYFPAYRSGEHERPPGE